MDNLITGLCAVVIAIICVLGVFSDFKDTAIQRIALGLGCVAASGVAVQCFENKPLPGSIDVLIWCLAAHCVEAARKFWKARI